MTHTIARRTLVFILIFSSTLAVYSQKQASWWYFGYGAGLDFTNTTTKQSAEGVMIDNVPTGDAGPISTLEGCFSISDKKGNFIMASNGVTVYNKNKAIMANGNGLRGSTDASQSGIVIPRPQMQNQFYIVTVDAAGGSNGIHYSIADLDANGGLGEVTTKNIAVGYGGSTITSNNANGAGQTITNALSYENISSVAHSNGIDFWLIQRTRDKFFAWLVTKDGINATPIFSETGRDNGHDTSGRGVKLGYVKFSPDGKLVAHAGGGSGWLTVGDFNTSTGDVTNIRERLIPNVVDKSTPLYGVEFSPSGKYVYVAQLFQGPVRCLPTDDLENGAMITYTNMPCTAVQLGPDGRMYGVGDYYNSNKKNLWIIEKPELPDGVSYKIENAFASNTTSALGLPSFNVSFFNINVDGDNIFCVNQSKYFNITIEINGALPKDPKYTIWNFGDGSAPTQLDATNIPGTQTKTHTYESPGHYIIIVKVYDENEEEIPEMAQTFDVFVKACVLPVNPNIHSFNPN